MLCNHRWRLIEFQDTLVSDSRKIDKLSIHLSREQYDDRNKEKYRCVRLGTHSDRHVYQISHEMKSTSFHQAQEVLTEFGYRVSLFQSQRNIC